MAVDSVDFNDYSWYAPNMVFVPLCYIAFFVIALPLMRRVSQKVRVLNTNNQRKFLMNILELLVSSVGVVVILSQGIPTLIRSSFDEGVFRLVRGLVCVPMTYVFMFKMVYRLETHWTMSVHHVVAILFVYFALYSIDSTPVGAQVGIASWLYVFLLGHVITDQLALLALLIHRLQMLYTNMWLRATTIQMIVFKFAFSAWLTFAWAKMCFVDNPSVTPVLAWQIIYIPFMLLFHGVQLYGWGLVFSSKRRRQQVRRLSLVRNSVAYDGPFALKLKDMAAAAGNPRASVTTQRESAQNEASLTATPPDSRQNSIFQANHHGDSPPAAAANAATAESKPKDAVAITIRTSEKPQLTPRSEMKQPDRIVDVFDTPVRSKGDAKGDRAPLVTHDVSSSSLAAPGLSPTGTLVPDKEPKTEARLNKVGVPEESEVSSESERPGELEVRVIADDVEKPIGLIEVGDMDETLLTFRLKILEELDHVPAQFIFVMNGQPVPVTKEPRLKLSMITNNDVIRIRIPSSRAQGNAGKGALAEASARDDANDAHRRNGDVGGAIPPPWALSNVPRIELDEDEKRPDKPDQAVHEKKAAASRPSPADAGRHRWHGDPDERPLRSDKRAEELFVSSASLSGPSPGAPRDERPVRPPPRVHNRDDSRPVSSGSLSPGAPRSDENLVSSPRGKPHATTMTPSKEAVKATESSAPSTSSTAAAAMSPRKPSNENASAVVVSPRKPSNESAAGGNGLGGVKKQIGYNTALKLVVSNNNNVPVSDDDDTPAASADLGSDAVGQRSVSPHGKNQASKAVNHRQVQETWEEKESEAVVPKPSVALGKPIFASKLAAVAAAMYDDDVPPPEVKGQRSGDLKHQNSNHSTSAGASSSSQRTNAASALSPRSISHVSSPLSSRQPSEQESPSRPMGSKFVRNFDGDPDGREKDAGMSPNSRAGPLVRGDSTRSVQSIKSNQSSGSSFAAVEALGGKQQTPSGSLALRSNKAGVSAKVFQMNRGLGALPSVVAKPAKGIPHIGADDTPPPPPDEDD